ncbi:MAG: sialate O-acetylesterase [Verrucomicrobia bacterium]|nr:MAG: sialate O-acetylesterase [Verrucomicrobiota bacterium]
MKHPILVLAVLLPWLTAAMHAATLTVSSPLDYQVVQRASRDRGVVRIAGEFADPVAGAETIEARLVTDGKGGKWRRIARKPAGARFEARWEAPAGGWHRLEVRAMGGGKVLAETAVAHVGVGEVFVVAGQSNSANHGEERQQPKTGMVAAFDGKRWQVANDPQPGAGGGGGSFMPPFGDAIAARFRVPVGIVACGEGGTSVREWLPKGARFPNPPTVLSHVSKLLEGDWTCDGVLYAKLVARMQSMGARGFRAVLWHQGESDANQRDTTRTLAGPLYRDYLARIVRDSRREAGWEVPWFVAQASYHVPGDESSPEIRAAQAALWKDGVALEGPDTDALKGALRDGGGQGVHFSGPGLREHGVRWAEKVGPWIERSTKRGLWK